MACGPRVQGDSGAIIREWMLEITWWCSLHHWQDQPLNQVNFYKDNVWRRSNEINFGIQIQGYITVF